MSSDVSINFTTNAEDAAGQVDSLNESLQQTGGSASDVATTASTNWGGFEATLGRTSVMGAVMLDRLSIAQNAVENAQIRADLAQQRYNDTVTKYGPASAQAVRAHQELEIATRGVEIATQREEVRMLIMAGITIPQMVRGVYSMIGVLGGYTDKTAVATFGTVALTNAMRALLAASIVGIPMVLMTAALFEGGFGGTTSNNVSVYGDINLQGVQGPAQFASSMAQSTRP